MLRKIAKQTTLAPARAEVGVEAEGDKYYYKNRRDDWTVHSDWIWYQTKLSCVTTLLVFFYFNASVCDLDIFGLNILMTLGQLPCVHHYISMPRSCENTYSRQNYLE